jgi:hypothetical protein
MGQPSSGRAGRLTNSVHRSRLSGAVQAVGQDLGRQAVPAGRQRDVDLAVSRAAVELRRSAGTRTGSPASPSVLDFQKPALDQAIEMKRGQRATDFQRRRGMVATDGLGCARDELVQLPSDRLGQESDPVEIVVCWS